MGNRKSKSKQSNLAIPPYTPAGGTGISRPGARDPQRELMQANQTIQNLNNQLNALRGGGGGGPGAGYPGQNMPYNAYPQGGMPPMFGQMNPYGSIAPGGLYSQGPPPAVYRDTDFAALASISGLTPADISLLHHEFINLTRGGTTKMDRAIFRDLLREILFELNNENVDRAIENIFVSVDRNRDGYVDFPEFVGAFKDVLKGGMPDSQFYNTGQNYSDLLAEQLRATGVGSGIVSQPIQYNNQSNSGVQVLPITTIGVQPTIAIDSQPSAFVIAAPTQYLITQPTTLQCTPLAII